MKNSVVLLMALAVVAASGCRTLEMTKPLTAELRADSAVVVVTHSDITYTARIGFVFVNTTGGPVSFNYCGVIWPALEKKVDGKWVIGYTPISPLCLRTYVLQSGDTLRDTIGLMDFDPGHHYAPERVVPVDGIYRLHFVFAEGTQPSENTRKVEAFSQEFRMVQR